MKEGRGDQLKKKPKRVERKKLQRHSSPLSLGTSRAVSIELADEDTDGEMKKGSFPPSLPLLHFLGSGKHGRKKRGEGGREKKKKE